MDRLYVTYYATRNRRAPWVAIFGHWPHGRGIMRSCEGGVKLLVRGALPNEVEFVKEYPFYFALRWPTLLAMLSCEAENIGIKFGRRLVKAVREKRALVSHCMKDVVDKQRKHKEKLAARRTQLPIVTKPKE